MYCRIIINMDNDAFQENEGLDNGGTELARILTAVAEGLEITGAPDEVTLKDSNGLKVGHFMIINDDYQGES